MPKLGSTLLILAAGVVLGLLLNGNLGGNWLLYLLILVCPLMMLAMMGGHGHGDHRDHPNGSKRGRDE